MTTPLLFTALGLLAFGAILRVTYCWAYARGVHAGTEKAHVRNIKAINQAWRAGMLAERMRGEKLVTRN